MNKILVGICSSVILSGILLSLDSAKLCADVSADAAPQINMQVATGTKLTLGEPIVLHAEITNSSPEQKLWVQTGLYQTDWYTLSLVDSTGNLVAALPDTRTREPRGVYGPDIKTIEPSDASSIDIVATRFLSIPHPGKYFLKVHVQAPYVKTEAASENTLQVQSQLKATENVLVRDFIYQLTVAPADPVVLQSRANVLEQNILRQTVGKSHDTDLDALFSMPANAAAASWQRLANTRNSDTQERVADHLANLHTSKAVDILFKMLDNPTGNTSFVSEKLAQLYNEGDPALRKHIKSIAAQKGLQLPEQIDIPQVID